METDAARHQACLRNEEHLGSMLEKRKVASPNGDRALDTGWDAQNRMISGILRFKRIL